MSGRLRTMHVLIRGASLVVALFASLVVAQGGIARFQAAGALAKAELRLASVLAMGGTLSDLCEDADPHCLSCEACDTCCLQAAFALPAAGPIAEPRKRAAARQTVLPGHIDIALPRAPPGPPVRAPPIHI